MRGTEGGKISKLQQNFGGRKYSEEIFDLYPSLYPSQMSLISSPSQSKGGKETGSTGNCGSSEKCPFIQE